MRSHLKRIARQKVSDFLLREEGMIGSRTGFATAAVVSTTALAMTLLLAPDAEAQGACGPDEVCVPGEKCCEIYDGGMWHYFCVDHLVECNLDC